MEKITIIVPVHEYNDEVKNYLTKAIGSVNNLTCSKDSYQVTFVAPSDVIEIISKDIIPYYKDIEYSLITNDGDTDFFSQVNLAVKQCVTKYFTILEFDDTFESYWFDEFAKYSTTYNDASVYMSITELYNPDETFYAFSNEVAWAMSDKNNETDELGYLDLDTIKDFMDFAVTGAIINTEKFVSLGGLKSSLSIAAWYEFLMRFANNGENLFVIPKVGYKHMVKRDNSFMKITTSTLTQEEGQALIERAREEYKFIEERDVINADPA